MSSTNQEQETKKEFQNKSIKNQKIQEEKKEMN